MSNFKIYKGKEQNLPSTKKDGSMYYCTDTGSIYMDYIDDNNQLQRIKSNSQDFNDLHLIEGQGENSILVNDVENNQTNINNAFIAGANNKAVIRGFKILNVSTNTTTKKTCITLANIDGLAINDVISYFYYVEGEGTYKQRATILDIQSGNDIIVSSDELSRDSMFYDPMSTNTDIESGNYIIPIKLASDGSWLGNTVLTTTVGHNNFTTTALGSSNVAGIWATATGYNNKALGVASLAEGWWTIASGERSHAESYKTQALGHESHAEGNATTALGQGSHTEGRVTKTTATGVYGHTEGDSTVVEGWGSHAEGYGTKVETSSKYGHAEGKNTTVSGNNAHAEGEKTKAQGESSHAEGYLTNAEAPYSHAEGYGTTTDATTLGQHVGGRYNSIPTDGKQYLEIIGRGSVTNGLSNARLLDDYGNAWYAGKVYDGEYGTIMSNDKNYQLTNKLYVNRLNDVTNTKIDTLNNTVVSGLHNRLAYKGEYKKDYLPNNSQVGDCYLITESKKYREKILCTKIKLSNNSMFFQVQGPKSDERIYKKIKNSDKIKIDNLYFSKQFNSIDTYHITKVFSDIDNLQWNNANLNKYKLDLAFKLDLSNYNGSYTTMKAYDSNNNDMSQVIKDTSNAIVHQEDKIKYFTINDDNTGGMSINIGPTLNAIGLYSDFSFVMWLKIPSEQNHYPHFLSWKNVNGTTDNMFLEYCSDNGGYLWFKVNETLVQITDIPINDWFQIGIVKQRQSANPKSLVKFNIYINGIETASTNYIDDFTITESILNYGGLIEANTSLERKNISYFSDFAIYNTTLNSSEILNIFNEDKHKYYNIWYDNQVYNIKTTYDTNDYDLQCSEIDFDNSTYIYTSTDESKSINDIIQLENTNEFMVNSQNINIEYNLQAGDYIIYNEDRCWTTLSNVSNVLTQSNTNLPYVFNIPRNKAIPDEAGKETLIGYMSKNIIDLNKYNLYALGGEAVVPDQIDGGYTGFETKLIKLNVDNTYITIIKGNGYADLQIRINETNEGYDIYSQKIKHNRDYINGPVGLDIIAMAKNNVIDISI